MAIITIGRITMVRKSKRGATVSQCLCMQRCTPSSISLARHPRSSSKFKDRNLAYGKTHVDECIRQKGQQNKGTLQQTARNPSGVFQGPNSSSKGKISAAAQRFGVPPENGRSSFAGSKEFSQEMRRGLPDAYRPINNSNKRLELRRRDPRINGADLYVARVTKRGMGNAKPCWRCLGWCKWSGVWNPRYIIAI